MSAPGVATGCDCAEQVTADCREKLNVWLGQTLPMQPGRPRRVLLDTSWYPGYKPKRGEKCPALVADYCPFCGRRYEDADA